MVVDSEIGKVKVFCKLGSIIQVFSMQIRGVDPHQNVFDSFVSGLESRCPLKLTCLFTED